MNKWLTREIFKESWLFQRAKAVVRVLPRPGRKTSPTAGLANMVLHQRRINHTIIDPREKTRHLFKITRSNFR